MKTIGIATLAARIAAGTPRLGHTRLVCIDGPAGSGKTTLAGSLRLALAGEPGWDVPVVHMDDCYEGWTGLNDEVAARIDRHILDPLRSGRPGRYRRYDWHHARFAESHLVEPAPALILEGVGSAPLSFASSVSLLVWVEAHPDDRLRRGIARDGDAVAHQWQRWMVVEAEFAAAERTRERADLIVDGSAGPDDWPRHLVVGEQP